MLKQFLQKIPETFQKDKDKTYIAVIGSRTVNDYEFLCNTFIKFIEITEIDDIQRIVFVSGGAKGVDQMARRLASELNKDIIEILPDWKKHGKRAGVERNKEIIKLADYILAIPGKNSKGTRQGISYANQIRKPIFIFEYPSNS